MVPRLTETWAETLADARTGKNGRHRLADLLRQSLFGQLAGYEDVNDDDRLCRSAMRDLLLSKRPERAILDSQPPGIGGMSVNISTGSP